MKFKIRGCRGSIAVSGPAYTRYGGDTTCFEVNTDDVRILIDAGSGLAPLGRSGEYDGKPTLLFLTHFHTDHLVGFPHFLPIFLHEFKLQVAAVPRGGLSPYEALIEQHKFPFFPVPIIETIQANITETTLRPEGTMEFGDIRLRWMDIEHPGGNSGVRIEHAEHSVVILSDLEYQRQDPAPLRELTDGADVVLFDAQYTEPEYEQRRGWGHSTHMDAAEFARTSNIGDMLMVHHDPARTDVALQQMVKEAQSVYPRIEAARQGKVLTLE